MKHLGLNAFPGSSNCCSRVAKRSKADPCLEAEALGLNKNKQRNHVVHLAVREKNKKKISLQNKKGKSGTAKG